MHPDRLEIHRATCTKARAKLGNTCRLDGPVHAPYWECMLFQTPDDLDNATQVQSIQIPCFCKTSTAGSARCMQQTLSDHVCNYAPDVHASTWHQDGGPSPSIHFPLTCLPFTLASNIERAHLLLLKALSLHVHSSKLWLNSSLEGTVRQIDVSEALE